MTGRDSSPDPISPLANESRSERSWTAVYFGCWDAKGHGFHTPDGRSASYKTADATDIVPWGYGVEDLAPSTRRQGTSALHHQDGWTALAIDDFTVDSRGNSKSVFCFHADLDFSEALAEAARAFPRIVNRLLAAAPILQKKDSSDPAIIARGEDKGAGHDG